MYEKPTLIEHFIIQKQGIQELKSGMNHIVLLSNNQVYTWGDNDQGALGTVFRKKVEKSKVKVPTRIRMTQCQRIFAGAYTTFIIRKGKLWAFGLNNYNQLGLSSEEGNNIRLPQIVEGLDADSI